MAQGSITTTDIRAALERVLANERFRQSPQLSAFLSYVVEQALNGQAYAIKGYTIATEVFGRSMDFDPQADPIVRVEARRLRQLLATYYDGPGSCDIIEIVLPLGGYAPRFLHRIAGKTDRPYEAADAPDECGLDEEEDGADMLVRNDAKNVQIAPDMSHSPDMSYPAAGRTTADAMSQALPLPSAGSQAAAVSVARSHFFWPLLFALIAGFAVSLAIYLSPLLLESRPGERGVARERAEAAAMPVTVPAFKGDLRAPVIAMTPFRVLGTPPPGDDTALRLTERLQDALARFDEVRVMTAEEWGKQGGARAMPTLYPDYRIEGRLIWRMAHQASLAVTLVDVPTSEILFAWEFEDLVLDTRPESSPDSVAENDALRAIVSQIARPYGLMFARWTSYASYSRSGRSSCLFATFEFWRGTSSIENTARLRPCLDAMIARGEETPGALALLAMVDVVDYSSGRLGDGRLEKALRLARQAVAMAPTSARAHQILMNVLFFRGETAPAFETGRQAVKLNPYDADVLADFGARLIAGGRYDEGLRKLKRAVEFTTARPPRQDFYLFLGSLMVNDRAAALDYAAAIGDVDSYYARIARCIAAVEKQDKEEAGRELERLVAILPGLAQNPRAALARWHFAPAVMDRLLEGLRAAGLDAADERR